MSALVMTELGLQVREGSALAVIADRELPIEPTEIEMSCAWCAAAASEPQRAKSDEATPFDRVLSHGICPECAEAMRAEYKLSVTRISKR